MCEKKGLSVFPAQPCLCSICDNEPATGGCSGSGPGLGETVTAKMRGEEEELNMKAVFIEGGDRTRQEEREDSDLKIGSGVICRRRCSNSQET